MGSRFTLDQQILDHGCLTPQPPYIYPIKRVRGNRLIDYDGNIYRDFYLHAGTVHLGYKPKPLSTKVSNRLSMGYLGGFYSHLHTRARKALTKHFQTRIIGDFFIYLFPTQQSRDAFLLENNIANPSICTVFSPSSLDSTKAYICDRSFSNGTPIDILLLPHLLPFTPSLDISPLHLEIIIQTLQQKEKSSLQAHTHKLFSPYKQFICQENTNVGKVLLDPAKWASVSKALIQKKILTDPENPKIYTCNATTAEDLHYFISQIKHML